MENKENELKELKSSRTANALSLRKQKLNEYILKRRLGSNNQDYTIQFSACPEAFLLRRFQGILRVLNNLPISLRLGHPLPSPSTNLSICVGILHMLRPSVIQPQVQ